MKGMVATVYLKEVLIRFFKSFNYDYLRKHHPNAKPDPWEQLDVGWFPFVRIPLMRDITTVVGANESGKSHLLSAVEKGLTGDGISRRDFCRYSQCFTVEEGKMRWPDFGFHFAALSSKDQEQLRQLAKIDSKVAFDHFILIRSDRNRLDIWLPDDGTYTRHSVPDANALATSPLLPKVFHIDSSVALPSSVPLSWLRGKTSLRWSRRKRTDLVHSVDGLASTLQSQDSIKQSAKSLCSTFSPFFGVSISSEDAAPETSEVSDWSFALARDLIFKVARIDKAAIDDLADALAQEDEGLANGILQQINQRLATALNFPKWWVQDRDFRLTVSARDDDLVFTIGDRTHTEYSFKERSNGLKYFLSYYIQYLAHESPDGRREILLMDEPDAYLSSQGQQDLLKIFNSFAHPDDGRQPVQVIYVTHSPFLIDRNHGERIRVLEKGADDEGTRIVNDASKNHYEPLRSSFGAFVAETTFIGNCNLMVEGLADQVLLAGCSTYLRARNTPRMNTLDLNRITIVPAGSASHIPYLVYLARGRDIEQPAVIVLLDGDGAGLDAQKSLRRGGPKGRQLIKPEYVLVASTVESSVALPAGKTLVEIEDLIPPGVAAGAARRYLSQVCGIPADETAAVTGERIVELWTEGNTLFDAISAVVQEHSGSDVHVDKVGFARAVVELIHCHKLVADEIDVKELQTFEKNFEALLARLTQLQRMAERDGMQERISQRVDRTIKAFLRDHTTSCRREDAIILIEEIEAVLDDSLEGDEVRLQLQKLRRAHDLTEPKPGMIEEYAAFSEELRQVRYAAVNAVQQDLMNNTRSRNTDTQAIRSETTEIPAGDAESEQNPKNDASTTTAGGPAGP